MRRIRTRLLGAILLAALVPAVPATWVVRSLLERSQAPALQSALIDGLKAGMAESRLALHERKQAFAAAVAAVPADAGGIVVLGEDGRPRRDVRPPLEVLGATSGAERGVVRQAGGWLLLRRAAAAGGDQVLAQPLPAGAADRAAKIGESLTLAAAYRLDRGAVLRGYVLPFLCIYVVLLLAALALAALLARGVVAPLEETARAADRVAAGDLDVRVGREGPGEVGALVRAFNGMVARLGEQRRELARLEKLAAWRGMARTLAHEIKNPLTPILMAVQEARGSYRGDDETHAAVLEDCESIVREEVDGLRRLVASFGEFARMPRPEPRDDDLRPLLDDLTRLYGDSLAVDLPPGPAPCRFDAEALRRALINLIDNALGACERAGRPPLAELRARVAPAAIVLSVADAGDGVPPENRDRVFDPDFSTRGGMGLGLAIVSGVVEGHGGTLSLDSEPGRGTTVTVALPQGGAGEER